MSKLEMKIHNNIVEHLGVKLYQNKPTNVIAEFVSNAWDADADNVFIKLEKAYIAISDDGKGMSFDTLANTYMVIGKSSRNINDLKATTAKGRKISARKGLGKLAGFGIANKYNVITKVKENSTIKITWFIMDYEDIIKEGSDTTYKPNVLIENKNIDDINYEQYKQYDHDNFIYDFIVKNKESSGTLVLLEDLKIRRALSPEQIKKSLGKRFVFLMSDQMKVFINNETVTKEFLPQFYFRVPKDGKTTITLSGGQEVSYWIGFTEKAMGDVDSNGIGIYAHEKLCVDRPFYFHLKGQEIWTRYVYGVFEADWLDEITEEDVIGTDRTTINWEREDTGELLEKGEDILRSAIQNYRTLREEKEETRLKEVFRENNIKVTDLEQSSIIGLIKSSTVKYDKKDIKETLGIMTKAWMREPVHKLIQDVWQKLGNRDIELEAINEQIDLLIKYSVPESISLAVEIAQRLNAITCMRDLVFHGREVDMQKLIERFPWLLGKRYSNMTANKTIQTLLDKKNRYSSGSMDGQLNKRPDFVFLEDGKSEIVVIEIKNPKEQLNYDNLLQLIAYKLALTEKMGIEVYGELIGNNPEALRNASEKDNSIRVRSWNDVYEQVAHEYFFMLIAMLEKNMDSIDSNDSRILSINEFGGEIMSSMIDKYSQEYDNVKEVSEFLNNLRKK